MARKDPRLAQKIRTEIKKWDDNWRSNRTQYHEFTNFILGKMWEDDESKVFTRYNKMPLTFNKLAPLSSYMLGEQRQNTPVLQVCPDEDVPEETVEAREALVKHIVLDSDTKIAFQHAFQCAVIGGFGAFEVTTAFENEHSFNQDIKINRIQDPTRCYWDVGAENPCKTDGMRCGKRTRVSRAKFASLYGKKLEQQIPSSSFTEDTSLMSFNDDDSITIIDDYERTYDTVTIYKLSNGRTVEKKELDNLQKIEIDGREILMDNGTPVEVEDERDATRYKIIHRKMAGDFELEKTHFSSEQLPIPFVDQNSYWDKNGKQICRPFFKDTKDAQRYLNYLGTQSAYLVKISRYDQFMGPKSAVRSADTESIWRDPSTQQGMLVYDESPSGAKPEQLRPAELSASLIQQYERTLRDIETSTGIYSTQLGQQGNEISGSAVDSRTRQGSYNTYVPYDSINRAIACCGQIVNEMIPHIYDNERMMMLKMSDDMVQPVSLNQPADPYGTAVNNDMKKGRYKIRLMPGPGYEGQKKEALDSFNMVLAADKTGQVFPMIADLYVENLPLPNNIQLRNRLRTLVPAPLIEAGKTGKPMPPQPQQPDPQMMIAQMQMQLQEKEIQAKFQDIQMKTQAKMQEIQLKQMELQMKAKMEGENIAQKWQELENDKLEAAAKLQEQELRYQAEMNRMQADQNIAHAENVSNLLIHAGEMTHKKYDHTERSNV